ncbi:MAG: hypothetical protein AAGD43_06820 [Pseudomonadota bacterium]
MLKIVDPFDWNLLRKRPGKEIWIKIDRATDEVLIREDWIEEDMVEVAKAVRDRPPLVGPDLRPLAVIPAAVQSQAINEGWINDRQQWKKWMNDIDNRYLRTSDGVA